MPCVICVTCVPSVPCVALVSCYLEPAVEVGTNLLVLSHNRLQILFGYAGLVHLNGARFGLPLRGGHVAVLVCGGEFVSSELN
jgi:hypothetical protein